MRLACGKPGIGKVFCFMKEKKTKNNFRLLFSRNIDLKYFYSSLRRRFIYYFKREYYNRKLAKRKGRCLGEAHCCLLAVPWCPFLRETKCRLYARQPFFCRIFPIDEKDQELNGIKGVCGYYFE